MVFVVFVVFDAAQRRRRDSNPRHLRAAVFKTAAFNRSATPPTAIQSEAKAQREVWEWHIPRCKERKFSSDVRSDQSLRTGEAPPEPRPEPSRLLILLEDRDQRPTDRQRASVQGVHEPWLLADRWTISDVRARRACQSSKFEQELISRKALLPGEPDPPGHRSLPRRFPDRRCTEARPGSASSGAVGCLRRRHGVSRAHRSWSRA